MGSHPRPEGAVAVIKSFEMELEPDRGQVSRARRFVVEVATMIGQDDLADIVELLTSELVTNAVLHARSQVVHINVTWQPPVFRVVVSDDSTGEPMLKHFSDEAATGRGLVLVEELSNRWGSDPVAGGKDVWFEMDVAVDDAREPALAGSPAGG
jgi:anti-sigma regulatory factor (Ser/Thr protein kinase)